MPQLQKLLQTYFGAIHHSTSSSGIPWEFIPESTETAEDWSSEERKAEEAYRYSFIIDQGIDDSRLDLAS